MKITKEQLKQIIKEELGKNYHLGNFQHGNPTTLYINFRNLKDVGENMPGGVDPNKISELLEQAFYDNNADYFLHHPFVKVDNTGGGGYIDPSQSKYKVFLKFEDEQQYEDFKTEELDLIMQQVNDKVEKYAMELRQYSLRFENKIKITKEHLQQIIKEEIKAVLKEKEGPKYVRDDAYVAKYDPAFRKEVCLGRKRNGEFVDWFVRDGKGRCEHVTLDESISDRFPKFKFGTDPDKPLVSYKPGQDEPEKKPSKVDRSWGALVKRREREAEERAKTPEARAKKARDERSQEIQKKREAERAARKAKKRKEMGITKEELTEMLKQIIKEEISNVLNEAWPKGVRKKGKDEAPKIVHPANKTMPGEQWYEDDENPYGERAKEGRREFAAQRRSDLGLGESYFDVAPASRDPEGRAVSDAGPVEENGLNQEARRKRETPAQKRRRSERERRDAELPPEWRSDRPEVKTTSLKDLKKMMKHVKENKKRPPFDAKLKDGKKIRVTGKVKGSDEYLTKNSGRIISSQIDWPETNKIK